jgi:hypothetical protein
VLRVLSLTLSSCCADEFDLVNPTQRLDGASILPRGPPLPRQPSPRTFGMKSAISPSTKLQARTSPIVHRVLETHDVIKSANGSISTKWLLLRSVNSYYDAVCGVREAEPRFTIMQSFFVYGLSSDS